MDSTLACLAGWMPHQRWYSSKGSAPRLRLLADRDLPSSDPAARVRTLIVVDDSATPSITYQVPIVQRVAVSTIDPGVDVDPGRIIGTTADGVTLIDGPHDPVYTAALLHELSPGGPAARATVLTGEQSNTSIIYAVPGADPLIVKLFRQLNTGLNPDIELQSALAHAGSAHVPRALAHLDASWPDPVDPSRALTGSLAFAQEFFPGVEDAWRVARRAANAAEAFTAPAHALGAATADVHLSLGRLLPTAPADDAARAAVAAAWRRRLSIAIAEVPQLERHHDAIAVVYRRAMGAPWPPLQRIHGDYHLGQVLHVPGRGWVLLDFEGEPMRPMPERRLPDSALRDVAGMLRSFDYVAGSLRQGDDGTAPPAESLAAWAHAARAAFLDGYEHRTGRSATGPLLDAFELDKAVYEAIYEARNRPDWLEIPLAAIDRLVGGA